MIRSFALAVFLVALSAIAADPQAEDPWQPLRFLVGSWQGDGKAETIVEATYKDEVLPGLSLQPDVQYVVHPGADPTIRNALVLGLRVQFDFKLK